MKSEEYKEDIRKQYDEYCEKHINGHKEKIKDMLEEYEVLNTSKEYRDLLIKKISEFLSND